MHCISKRFGKQFACRILLLFFTAQREHRLSNMSDDKDIPEDSIEVAQDDTEEAEETQEGRSRGRLASSLRKMSLVDLVS